MNKAEPTYRVIKRWTKNLNYKIMRIKLPKEEAIEYTAKMNAKNKNPNVSFSYVEDDFLN